LNTGLDPEDLSLALQLVGKYVELGISDLKGILREVYNKYGEKNYQRLFRPIKAGYNGYKTDASDEVDALMDDYGLVKKLDVDNLLKEFKEDKNVSGTTGNLESDSPRGELKDKVGGEDVQSDGGREKQGIRKGTEGDGEKGDGQLSDTSVSTGDAIDGGEPSDIGLYDPQPEPGNEISTTGVTESERSGESDETGARSERQPEWGPLFTPESEVRTDEMKPELLTEQKTADNIPVKIGDIENIRQTLPYLLPGQHEDVLKAETRFFDEAHQTADKQYGRGMLFTNGTGTGKTFTGLGIAKRFFNTGKKNILIVTPSDAIAKKWIEDGKNVKLPITQLASTIDKGKDVSVTTYANFRDNAELPKKEYDLVIYDEAHTLVSNIAGSTTSSDTQHKNLTYGGYARTQRAKENIKFKEKLEKIEKSNQVETSRYKSSGGMDMISYRLSDKGEELVKKLNEELETEKQRLLTRTKVLFLSATPFSYHKNLTYADGYLFNINDSTGGKETEGRMGTSYNAGSGEDRFFMTNFGYRMRYNKLTIPEAGVDMSLMERNFAEKLLKDGVMSARKLDVPYDYSRDFVVTDSEIGQKIDDGIKAINDRDENNKKLYPGLDELAKKKHSYLYTNQLLEAIKALHILPRIEKHLKMNRKIILFHGYNNALPSHPFEYDNDLFLEIQNPQKARASLKQFNLDHPEYAGLDLQGLGNPILTIKNKFPESLIFNGTVSKKDRQEAIKLFNDDKSGKDILIVQMDAGKEGISLHDLTGVKQRVIINMGLPVKPTMAIQTEGRAYRIGQMSNAVFEYPVINTNFERFAFASKIADRVKTPENLALGNEARDLETAFKEGYQNAGYINVSDKQGIGGKQSDYTMNTIDEYDKAKTYYYGKQKRNNRDKSIEGVDYFATPEPVGLKMAQWLYSKPNEHLLEPSAGDGAIARFFPGDTVNQFIEPSTELRSRLAINASGTVRDGNFEDYYVGNKFNGIATNPPFGKGGSTAIKHIEKDMQHLKDGGRIVALVPVGSFDAKFDKLYDNPDYSFVRFYTLCLQSVLPL